jgi:predicted nicotinamide N-methyase
MASDAEQPPEAAPLPDFVEDPLTGGLLWSCSVVLKEYLTANAGKLDLAGKEVLELGAGLALAGQTAAKLGAHVTCTDMPRVMPELEATLAAAGDLAPGSIRAKSLLWGEAGFGDSALASEDREYDVILGSELYYIEETFMPLIWTLKKFMTPRTVYYSIFLNRPFSMLFLAYLHDEDCFEVEQIPDSEFDARGLEDPLFHRITLKR